MSLFFQNWDTSLPYIINYSLLYIGIHEVAFEFVCETELTINYSYTLETIQEIWNSNIYCIRNSTCYLFMQKVITIRYHDCK
jgi:hypothetical protein